MVNCDGLKIIVVSNLGLPLNLWSKIIFGLNVRAFVPSACLSGLEKCNVLF